MNQKSPIKLKEIIEIEDNSRPDFKKRGKNLGDLKKQNIY